MHAVTMESGWSRAEKEAILDAYGKKAATKERQELLRVTGTTDTQIRIWQSEAATGALRDDASDLPDGSNGVLALAQFFRDMVTKGRAKRSVSSDSLAGAVVFDDSGIWRANYLARSRRALKHIFDHLEPIGEAILSPSKGLNTADAFRTMRAYWGVDRYPTFVLPRAPSNAAASVDELLAAGWEDDALRKKVARWTAAVLGHKASTDALREWLRNSPVAMVNSVSVAGPTAPSWHKVPVESWPVGDEGHEIDERVRKQLGPLDELTNLGDQRYRRVLHRRTARLIDDYVGDLHGQMSLIAYLRTDVVRSWLPSSLTRLDIEDSSSPAATAKVQKVAAAIAALCLHDAIIDWDHGEMVEALNIEVMYTEDTVSAGTPLDRERAAVIKKRFEHENRALEASATLIVPQRRVQVTTPPLPAFVLESTEAVQDLYVKALQAQQVPDPVFVARYLKSRRLVDPKRLPTRSRTVVVIADYVVGLVSSRLHESVDAGQRGGVREALLASSNSAGSAYSLADSRNEAIDVQQSDPGRSIEIAWATLRRAESASASSPRQLRQLHEMRQQLSLLITGTHAQLVEKEFTLSSEELQQGSKDSTQYLHKLLIRGHTWADRALGLILDISRDNPTILGARFNDGYISDKSFIFTAYEMYHRMTCASALAQDVYKVAVPLDFDDLLRTSYHRLTTYPHAIPDAGFARAIQSILLHAFLEGMKLPALTEDANSAFVRLDPVARPRSSRDRDSSAATTRITLERLDSLTNRLVEMNWDAGAIGRIRPGSPAWLRLDALSEGNYSRWRFRYGDTIIPRD